MKLLFSTRDLEIGGRPIEGFPLLIDDDCMPLQPAQNFLLHALLESGLTRSKLTWEGIHDQHREMLELDDLGPVANARIRRDLALSAKVIAEFGVPVDRGTAEIQSVESNRI